MAATKMDRTGLHGSTLACAARKLPAADIGRSAGRHGQRDRSVVFQPGPEQQSAGPQLACY